MNNQAIQTLLRLKSDYEFFSNTCLRIRTKDGQIKPFVWNDVQKRLAERVAIKEQRGEPVRFIINKARQQGFTTWVAGYQLQKVIFSPAHYATIIAHDAEATNTIFETYKRYFENIPEALKPSTKYSSRTEIVFNKLDSGLRVATAGGKGILRGSMMNGLHLSEAAFWQPTFANENFGGLVQTVPNSPGTWIFIESTSNGSQGLYFDIWQKAVSGENEYEPFFAGWYETKEYSLPVRPKLYPLTQEEKDIKAKYALTDEQLQWRRDKVATNGPDAMRQEYPATASESFLASGMPVFSPDIINSMIEKATELKTTKYMLTPDDIEENIAGQLTIFVHFRNPDTGEYQLVNPQETYTIGADVGMGTKDGDFSVAQVLDSKCRLVASFRARVHPDYFGKLLFKLGTEFNDALIVPERNNHGLTTCITLRDMSYPHLYREVKFGKVTDDSTILLGHFTSEKTKPLIINNLRAAVRKRQIFIPDLITLSEMLTYVFSPSGKMGAQSAVNFDDCVMSLALAYHGFLDNKPISYTNEFYPQGL